MELSAPLIEELRDIISKKYKVKLNDQDISKLAHSLTGYFELQIKINMRDKYGEQTNVK